MRFILFFLLIVSNNLFAQQNSNYSVIKYSNCKINDTHIDSINATWLVSNKGKPTKVTTYISDYNFKKIKRIYYKKNYFDFVNGTLLYFCLVDTNFYFTRFKLSVGDSEKKLKKIFPTSFSEGKSGDSYKIMVDCENTGKYIIFEVKKKKIAYTCFYSLMIRV